MGCHQRMLTILLCFSIAPSAALISRAQDTDFPGDTRSQASNDDRPDPPARAARLQYMSGSVSVQPHGTDDWAAGALNRPLTNGDNVWADKDSKAEISVGTGLIRIDSESSLTLTNVDENIVQLQLHQGALNLHVRRLYDNEKYEVDTPNQAFTVLKPGDYRFDVDSEADKTVITVWRGAGESTGDGPAVRIRENQQARFANGTSTEDPGLHEAPAPDNFDEWARSRDERLDRSASARYVSPDVVGYEDLDEYGNWKNSPQYGPVWVPSDVPVGWAPYHDGHWIWVDPWGWTWVDDAPWGYAPFHYGRWVYWSGYWGWAPGPVYVRPYYAPALVAWFGGPSWGVSVGFGGGFGYGWCPLGWGEPYVPWYGVSRGYFNQVNITNTHFTNVNITNIYNNTYINGSGQFGGGGYARSNIRYANLREPNGFTAVPRSTLLNSQSVARTALRVSPNQLSRVAPVRTLDVRPTRTTMLGGNAGRMTAAPPPRSFARPVVSRVAAPSAMRANTGVSARTGFGGAPLGPNTAMNAGVQRPMNMPNRSMGPMAPNSNMRVSDRAPMPSRSVPHPPSASGWSGTAMRSGIENSPRSNISRPSMGTENGRNNHGIMRPQSVPRPQSSVPTRGYSSMGQRSTFPSANDSRSQVPRPAPSYQPSNRGYGNGSYSRSEPNYGSYGRPTPSNGGGSYNRPSPSYGSSPSSRPSQSYDRGSYGRSMPSYGGTPYGRSMPSYSSSRPTPSYGGPTSRSMPSYGGGSYGRSMSSYGGGGHSMPSYGGGHSTPSYGGSRGPSSGGGGGGFGGHVASNGGGGHSGGSHGGHH